MRQWLPPVNQQAIAIEDSSLCVCACLPDCLPWRSLAFGALSLVEIIPAALFSWHSSFLSALYIVIRCLIPFTPVVSLSNRRMITSEIRKSAHSYRLCNGGWTCQLELWCCWFVGWRLARSLRLTTAFKLHYHTNAVISSLKCTISRWLSSLLNDSNL